MTACRLTQTEYQTQTVWQSRERWRPIAVCLVWFRYGPPERWGISWCVQDRVYKSVNHTYTDTDRRQIST